MFILSIALVTRNRSESLERTLKSLRNQTVQPFEVVISDDSDLKSHVETNREIASRYNCKYIEGPGRGLYANRNFAAMQCIGTHIRTMDDDHEFPINHMKECLKAVHSDDQAIWTIGEYLPNDIDKHIPAPVPGQLHPRGFSYVPSDMDYYYGISCGGSIYPRSVIERGILNSELYRFGILYLEYGARLVNYGYNIKYLNTTYLIHYYNEFNRSVSAQEILDGAQVFSMLMFSFCHKKTFHNKALTVLQIFINLAKGKNSLEVVFTAFRNYKTTTREIHHLLE